MVATNGASISTVSPSREITTTGPPAPGGLQGASSTWFVIVILLFLLIIFVFVLLICIRGQRLKEGKLAFYPLLLGPQHQRSTRGWFLRAQALFRGRWWRMTSKDASP